MPVAADLNRLGKRPRSSSNAQGITPVKRQHVQKQDEKQSPAVLPSTSRKSATSLRSRHSLPISPPVNTSHGPEVYNTPESPESLGKNRASPAKSHGGRIGENKVMKRKLNRKADKSITNNKGFDPRRQSAFNPLLVAGVKLTTEDSPGKNTRARRQGPLKKLDTNYSRIVPVDVDSEREAGPELDDVDHTDLPFTSGQGLQDRDESGVAGRSERLQQDNSPEVARHDATDTGIRQERHRRTSAARAGNTQAETEIDGAMPRQQLTDQDRNYMLRTYEENTRKDGGAAEKSNITLKAHRSSSQAHLNNRGEKEKQSDVRSAEPRKQLEEDEELQSSEGEEHIETTKRKARNKMSEAEKRAKKEEKARIRQEHAGVSEAAEIEQFEANGKEFVKEIEDLVTEVGGVEAWFKLGAGAKTITAMAAVDENKKKMDEARADVLWRKLSALREIFSGEQDTSEERVDHLIRTLLIKSTWPVLTRNEPIQEHDTTVIDLYKHIIPLSVYVLKEQLSGRFLTDHLVTWRELRSLLLVAISLSDVATDWDPKPAILETGIRGQVRRNIRPSLMIIHKAVQDTMAAMEYRKKAEKEHSVFTKRQQAMREEKRRMWERINQQHLSTHPSSQPVDNPYNHAASQQARDEDLEVAFGTTIHRPGSIPSRRGPPPPPLRRRPTEEIPAPDPNTTWSEKENVALLNGLQKHIGNDRYAKILKDPKFARALRGKDVEQCIGRAVFFQAGCSQILKEKADTGDSSFDWLRSV